MPREFARHQRLRAQLLRVLSSLIRFEVKDPGLANVSLTEVDLTRDLSVAKVYFNMLEPDADPALVYESLERAAGFLRRKLGGELMIRHVPELRFLHDDSSSHGAEIARLIEEAKIPKGNL